jgi:glycosyltransferase involved in cell wall biosynthesis
MWSSLTVVVPAYNEEDALPPTAERILDFLRAHVTAPELILVDDGSTDTTPQVIDQLAALHPEIRALHLDRNRGMGAALQRGYAEATADWITMLPADGQIDPSSLPAFFTAAREDAADLVTSIYQNRRYPPHRKILSVGLRALTAVIVGTRARTEGTYLVRRDVLERLGARSDSFMLNLEIPIRAKRAGYRVSTIAIDVHDRVAGESKAATPGRIAHTLRELINLRIRLERERRAR